MPSYVTTNNQPHPPKHRMAICRLVDCCGLAVTCRSEKALTLFNRSLEAAISWRTNYLPDLYRALEEDEDFPLAHCLLVNSCTRS